MNEECLICGAPLEYLNEAVEMECAICHKKELSRSRCCKRGSYLSILAAVDFVRDHFGIAMEKAKVVCGFFPQNNQCLEEHVCSICQFSVTLHILYKLLLSGSKFISGV